MFSLAVDGRQLLCRMWTETHNLPLDRLLVTYATSWQKWASYLSHVLYVQYVSKVMFFPVGIGWPSMRFLWCCPLLIAVFSPFTAGGRKKYNREHLLSFRFLKECQEPPEGLFLPGAIGLVRKTGGDATGPMIGGFPRDPREDRHTGRDKRVCCVSVCIYACTYVFTCLHACTSIYTCEHVSIFVAQVLTYVYHQSDMFCSLCRATPAVEVVLQCESLSNSPRSSMFPRTKWVLHRVLL